MMEPTEIKVLVVDDQQLIRDGIASMLDVQEGITVVGAAENGVEAIDKAKEYSPDVVLMDIHMPELDGIGGAEKIKAAMPGMHILMLTTFDDEDYIIRALKAGASGYLLKDIPASDLAQAIKMVHAGVYQLAPQIAGKLIGNIQEIKKGSNPEGLHTDLTEREMEVLRLLATGATNREIADELFVSEGTVKNHVSNILSTLGLRDRIKAAVYAIENGLTSDS